MKPKKIIPVFLILTVQALTACSSTSGGGSSQPREVDVVVPPNSNSTVVVPPNRNSTVVVPSNSNVISP